jgi:hypothetical protein
MAATGKTDLATCLSLTVQRPGWKMSHFRWLYRREQLKEDGVASIIGNGATIAVPHRQSQIARAWEC